MRRQHAMPGDCTLLEALKAWHFKVDAWHMLTAAGQAHRSRCLATSKEKDAKIWGEKARHARHAVELHLRDELLRRAGVADAVALHVVVHEAHLQKYTAQASAACLDDCYSLPIRDCTQLACQCRSTQCNCTGVLDPMPPCFHMQHSLSSRTRMPSSSNSVATSATRPRISCSTAHDQFVNMPYYLVAYPTAATAHPGRRDAPDPDYVQMCTKMQRALAAGAGGTGHLQVVDALAAFLEHHRSRVICRVLGFRVSGSEAGYTLCPHDMQHTWGHSRMEVQQQMATCECPVRQVAPA